LHADLIIAGEGEYELTLRQLARDLPNVKFIGAQPHNALRAYYRHAIATLMPSICYEVFGIVLLESFAMRTPVIVRDLGGMPEAVEDSQGGFVYRSDDELVQAMTRVHNDPVLRHTLGENGYAAYLKLWNEEPHLQKYFELVERAREHKAQRATATSA
ncbi:MAG: glycosyltransferase, partial [Chloroflexi bacterium]|nr:glycosyltransferase [Chloroflexota bacterium]